MFYKNPHCRNRSKWKDHTQALLEFQPVKTCMYRRRKKDSQSQCGGRCCQMMANIAAAIGGSGLGDLFFLTSSFVSTKWPLEMEIRITDNIAHCSPRENIDWNWKTGLICSCRYPDWVSRCSSGSCALGICACAQLLQLLGAKKWSILTWKLN